MDTQKFYQALVKKDAAFEGTFYVGVRTTGVFCRPTCPARKPKFANCEFFLHAKDAVIHGYRPCLRCKPLLDPHKASKIVECLLLAIEANPEKRWTSADFHAVSCDESTARRQFKKRFGMTFVAYARRRRMGMALQEMRSGDKVIAAQLNAGYDSGSGFRDAFSKIMGTPPAKGRENLRVLQSTWIDTPLGPMVAVADEAGLYCLEFVDRRGLEREIERLRSRQKAVILPGPSPVLEHLKEELKNYFVGKLFHFKTPCHMIGTPFQRTAWEYLLQIPYGQTRSYLNQAFAVGNPQGYRAVANANGANTMAIIVPCHRVIAHDGTLGGYGGGLMRKEWLVDHERRCTPRTA